jgi:protein O-GlcNAc transferase
VIELKPDFVEAHSNLGNLLRDLGRLNEAEASCRQALQIQPDFAEAHNNLGIILKDLGRRNEAEASYRRALQIKPDYAEAHSNLGIVLKDLDRLDEAITSFRQALQVKPDYAEAHSNLIFALDFSESEDVASLQAERKAWGERHAASLYQQQRAFGNSLDPERRLRIGYVSADFREHSAARAFEGMLFYFDRQQYDIFAYSNNTRDDAVTQRFKQSVTGWRNIAGQSDAAVDELIQQDQIDILVDLSGHTAGNRLLVFARKAAPIQITAWGHATGTGVKAIDVFFADAVIVPPEEQFLYAETVRYLPCALCYSSDAVPPPVNALPALQQSAITFGSFNRLCKVTTATIALWSRVLQAIPESRLILKTGELDNDATRAYVTERLVRAGIDASRVELQGKTSWEKHMAAFNQIDIALDPFPQGGGITTLEGLLMGIPAITLRWPTIAGRISATILTTLGLTDWIAESEDAYVALAVSKARDREALAALRGTLRERFKRSVLGDARAYVRIVEAQYRELWRAWVQQQLAHDPAEIRASGAPTP